MKIFKYTLGITFFLIMLLSNNSIAQSSSDDGFKREYYESGKLLSETNCLGVHDSGIYREYYENGNIRKEVNYTIGQLNGPYTDYCEDGMPRINLVYKDNKRNGLYQLFYESGILQAEGLYKDDKEEGLHQVYYPNGELAAEINFKDGKEIGIAKTYYEDGKVWEEISYKNGKREDEYREYSTKGILKREIIYENGKIVHVNSYDDEQKIILEVLNKTLVKRPNNEFKGPEKLNKCVSDEVGMTFACDPDWKLSRIAKEIKITISQNPLVEFIIDENSNKAHFLSDLTRDSFISLNRYADNFEISRIEHCNRETVKVEGYLKDNPQARVLDYYLIDHLQIHSLNFTVNPKEAWKDYVWVIKEVADSIEFINQKSDIKLKLEKTDETCSDLIDEELLIP